MSKTVFYNATSQFVLTDEEFRDFMNAIKSSKGVYITRLDVFLTDKFIWAGKEPGDPNRVRLHDGGWAIKKYGKWVCAENEEVAINTHYYPELNAIKAIDNVLDRIANSDRGIEVV